MGDPPVSEDWLGIVRALGAGLLDHPYAPCHPPSIPPTEEHMVGEDSGLEVSENEVSIYVVVLRRREDSPIPAILIIKNEWSNINS